MSHCTSHNIPSNITLDKALLYLRQKGVTIRRGDLVTFDGGYRNDGVMVFDGIKIIDLYYEIDDYGSLPPEFRVIEDGTPIDYWVPSETQPGIDHNTIVWFNHLLVQDQCLTNIEYVLYQNGWYVIFTTFVYRNITYRIVYNCSQKIDSTRHLNEFNSFRDLLLQKNLIVFTASSEFCPSNTDNRTLFVSID